MNYSEIVLALLSDIGIKGASLDDRLDDDLSMDSQEVVELLVALANKLSIKIDLNYLKRDMRVSDVVELIKEANSEVAA